MGSGETNVTSNPGWAPTSSILLADSFSGPHFLHLQNGYKLTCVGLAYPTSGNLTPVFLEKLAFYVVGPGGSCGPAPPKAPGLNGCPNWPVGDTALLHTATASGLGPRTSLNQGDAALRCPLET